RGRRVVRPRSHIRHTPPVDPKSRPTLASARWPEICATVLLASSDKGGPDTIRERRPLIGMRPAAFRHQVSECRSDGHPLGKRFRPPKISGIFRPHGYKDEPRSQLRNPEV